MSPMPSLDLSIVVVAFGRPELLRATVRSVYATAADLRFELIVVDNGLAAGDAAALAEEWPALRLVPSPRNRGFAAANNLGIAMSAGRYVLLLNPDTVLPPGAAARLVAFMDAHPGVGLAGPRLMQPDGAVQRYSFGGAPTPIYLARRLWGHLRGHDLHPWSGEAPVAADWVAGTCLIARRAAIAAIGPLDERFFLYFEDVDWGLRARRAGWEVAFVPAIAILHVGGGSVGAAAVRFYDQSLVRLYRKYYGAAAGFAVFALLRGYRRAQRWLGRRRR